MLDVPHFQAVHFSHCLFCVCVCVCGGGGLFVCLFVFFSHCLVLNWQRSGSSEAKETENREQLFPQNWNYQINC